MPMSRPSYCACCTTSTGRRCGDTWCGSRGTGSWRRTSCRKRFSRAWRRPNILDQSGGSARAWLFTVARNLVVDEHRSARSRHEIGTDTVPEQATADGTDALLDAWLVSDALNELIRRSPARHRARVLPRTVHRRDVP